MHSLAHALTLTQTLNHLATFWSNVPNDSTLSTTDYKYIHNRTINIGINSQ